jgi:2-iminobutanoate/2-iminopropanoate deaminase
VLREKRTNVTQEDRRRAVRTDSAPTPVFSYSQGILSGDLLFVSGQVPVDPLTKGVPSGIQNQVRRCLDNVVAIAEAAGARIADAVRVGVYLADLNDFEEMDSAYREYFEEPLPARTTIGTGIRGFAVEIDAVIAMPSRR